MAEETPELPVVEEPQEPEAPAIDVDSLVAELEKAGISNAQDLQGKLDAGTQAGRMAQLLGDERQLTKQLQGKVDELSSKQPVRDEWDSPSEQPVDIEAVVSKSLKKAMAEERDQMQKAQQAAMQTWNEIQTDESYGLVKDVWEEKTRDPNFAFKVQSGLVDPMKEYAATVRTYYQGLLKQSHETITQLQGGGRVQPPHVETGEQAPANMVSETPPDSKEAQRLKELDTKARSGRVLSHEDELDVVGSVLGDIL